MSRLLDADPDSSSWWNALRAGKFKIPHCGDCGTHFFPPVHRCPACRSLDVQLSDVDGLGTVITWTTTHVALAEEFADDLPFTVALVQLAEGPRILGRLLEGQPLDGMRVKVRLFDGPDSKLVGFVPGVSERTAP